VDHRSGRRAEIELDALARVVVRMRLEILDGRQRSFGQLAAEARRQGLDVRDERDARALYVRAIRGGLVQIDVGDSRRKPVRSAENDVLSRALEKAAHQGSSTPWLEARVVDVLYPEGDAESMDDSIHEQLGSHAGAIWLATEVASGDRLCVSAGRAAVWSMNGLARTRGLSGVKLYSISGGSERGRGAVPGKSLNADFVVGHAIASCEQRGEPENVRYTTLPIALDPDKLQRDKEGGLLRLLAGHLLDDWWIKRRPDTVVLGFAAIGPEPRHPMLLSRNKAMSGLMEELLSVVERHRDQGLVVGEVAQHLWMACARSTPGYDAANELVGKLNGALVAPTLKGLSHARKRLLVGGGQGKVAVLRSLLSASSCFRGRWTALVTDSRTASLVVHALQRSTA